MRRALLTLFVLVFPLTATSREKIDPANYTLTAVVSAPIVKGSVKAGDIPTTSDPRCNHPAPMRPDGSSPMDGSAGPS